MNKGNTTLAALLASTMALQAQASEKEELLTLKNTTINLIELLVQQGVLDKQKAQDLIKAAEQKAAQEAKQQLAAEQAAAKVYSPQGSGDKDKNDKSVHVAYVPEFIKDEIRQQVRAELRDDVVKEVKAHAKEEKWGIPAALPEWVNTIKLSGDIRLRAVEDFFPTNNDVPPDTKSPYLDYLSINKDGGYQNALNKNEAFQNSSIDRLRFRERFRLGIDAQIAEGLKAGFRLATSNIRNPVSNNQTLGNTGQSFEFAIDRAFLQYDYVSDKGNDWFSVYGGRIVNPWMSTDILYDPDLSFEGLAGTFRLRFNQDDPAVKAYKAPVPNPLARSATNMGPQTPDTVFATLGVFPIQEVNFSSQDKWLFGGQLGADWLVHEESRLKIAAAYYDYRNIRARHNSQNSDYDWTAPQFTQKGNSMVAISDLNSLNGCNDPDGCLFGLASDFKIFNATAAFEFSGFGDTHIMLTADYVKNFGYNVNRIVREFPNGTQYDTNKARDTAYQVRLDVGNPEMRRFGDWNTFLAYRYVEADAVLDAFTDSVFHLGGTNAKGWVVGANYALAKNTWLNFRWFSTDNVEDLTAGNGQKVPFGIDTAILDLNARF